MIPEPVSWNRGEWSGWVVPGCQDLDPASLPWDIAARTKRVPHPFLLAKHSRSRLVIAVPFNGETVYVKRAVARSLPRRISASLRGPKTLREWTVARDFLAAGVRVPEPVLYAAGPGHVSFLATRGFPPEWRTVYAIVKLNGPDCGVLGRVGRYSRWLHDLPAFHADFRSDHLFVTGSEDGDLALMDLDGASAGRPVSNSRRSEALAIFFASLLRFGMKRRHVRELVDAYEGTAPRGLNAAAILEAARARAAAA